LKKIKILLTFFVATLLILGILSQLSVWYDNRAAAPAKRLLQGEIPRSDSEGTDAMWLMAYDIPDAAERRQRLAQIEEGAYFASERGLIVNAGHGLNIHNVAPIAKILPIAELNIGHALIAQALFLGLPAAIVQMKEAMFRARLSI